MVAAVTAAAAAPVVVAVVAAAVAAPVVVAVVAAAVAAPVVVAAVAAAPAVVATAAVAMLPGAVTGADIDCRYGPSKSNVSVMKISKKIKEEKKHTGDSIPIQQSLRRCRRQLVCDGRYGCCVFGETWWWEGGRTREERESMTKRNST